MKLTEQQIQKSTDLLVLSQILFDNLEYFEKIGLYRHNLKRISKLFSEELEKTLDSIYDKSGDNLSPIVKVYEFNEEYLTILLELSLDNKIKVIEYIKQLE